MKRNILKTPWWQRITHNKSFLLYLGGGILSFVLAWLLYPLWADNQANALLTVGMLVLVVLGGFLIFKAFTASRGTSTVIVGEKPVSAAANSLNIYVKKDSEGKFSPEKIAFELVDSSGKIVEKLPEEGEKPYHPPGQPWQSLDDSNWYYLNVIDIGSGLAKPFTLPDKKYFDPGELANVLEMRAHRALFTSRTSMFQKIAPWAMVVAFLVSIFGLIVVMG